MARVPQQGHAPLRLLVGARDRRAVAQRPQAPVLYGRRQFAQPAGAADQGGAQVFGMGGVVPVVQIGIDLADDDGDHIQALSGAHRVLHHVQLGPQPDRHLLAAQVQRQILLAHQRAVGQVAADARRRIAQQLAAHQAPQAVGANQGLALQIQTGGTVQAHAVGVLVEGDGALVQLQFHAIGFEHTRQQHLVQVGTVDAGVGRAVALLHRRPQGQRAEHRATGGAARLQPLGEGGKAAQRRVQAPALQDARDIRPHLDAGPNLAKGAGAFDQLHRPLGLRASQRCGQAAYAAPGDQYVLRHAPILRFAGHKTRQYAPYEPQIP